MTSNLGEVASEPAVERELQNDDRKFLTLHSVECVVI